VLAPLTLQTLLVDEAQAVKNASTTRAQALRRLQARARIALSGTPIENHTGEVWAILDLVVPGLFGTFAQFKARFADPIEKDHDETRRALLARALRPFVLRRTKAQVAKDLPEKIERTVILTPSPEEQASYERLRRAIVVDLDERGVLDGEPGDDRSAPAPGEQRVQILAALTRLRLAACHPALVDDVLDEAQVRPATKHKALLSLLEEVRESGHRALVFSQFVSHLRLAERFAKDVGLRTQHLTGETPGRERQALVDRFQQGDVDAFFISLKAGGFGLNLTRATTVVHLDPWWNPATEDQASDRAHRIGQTLPVTIVRLVMDGTIEAPILALHEKKRALADAVLAGTDAAGRLDVRELASLLRHTRRVVGDDAVELAGAV
jgi:SNF2 family DNA or RNA helicase